MNLTRTRTSLMNLTSLMSLMMTSHYLMTMIELASHASSSLTAPWRARLRRRPVRLQPPRPAWRGECLQLSVSNATCPRRRQHHSLPLACSLSSVPVTARLPPASLGVVHRCASLSPPHSLTLHTTQTVEPTQPTQSQSSSSPHVPQLQTTGAASSSSHHPRYRAPYSSSRPPTHSSQLDQMYQIHELKTVQHRDRCS